MIINNRFKKVCLCITIAFFVVYMCVISNADDSITRSSDLNPDCLWEGEGTLENPYLVQSEDDLIKLRNAVAFGETFEDCFFKQTKDILLQNEWVPIGDVNYGTHFDGVYDGNGNNIKNLRNSEYIQSGFALFNYFGGVIVNLGMEDVDISSDRSAALVYCVIPNTMNQIAILNCYSTGTITGGDCAGIAYELNNGTIANSFSAIDMQDATSKGILFQYGNVKIYCCNSLNELCDKKLLVTNSKKVTLNELKGIKSENNNIDTILTQHLFADHYNVALCKWIVRNGTENNDECIIVPINNWGGIINALVNFINDYIPIVVCATLIVLIVKNMVPYNGIYALMLISAIISFFLDCKMISLDEVGIIKCMGVILCNALFGVCFYKIYARIKKNNRSISKSLVFFMIIVFIAALFQINSVPRYDGAIYYGSLIRACDLFDLTLFSFIGAFVCWKWIHGAALFLAPFEFIIPGTSLGVNISVILIMEITIVVTYKLLKQLRPQFTELCIVLLSVLMTFMPYQIGMYNYLCMDTILSYFAVWLLYSYVNNNDYMISFCGFLLVFTKETGLVFYCSFLMAVTLISIVLQRKKDILKGIVEWFNLKRVGLWILPAFLYVIVLLTGKVFIIQNFPGAIDPFLNRPRSIYSYANTIADTFVWGYRWLFVLFIVFSLMLLVFYLNKHSKKCVIEDICLFGGVVFASIMVEVMLLLYKGDADCPRYTALFNIFYYIAFVLLIDLYSNNRKIMESIIEIALLLMVIQTYYSIDPFIISKRFGLETGNGVLYKLAFNSDDRKGMNIGMDYGKGYGSVGDVYAYNVQYNYYDTLIKKMMNEIQPDIFTKFYILDVVDYEMSLTGQQYPLFWDPEEHVLTYKQNDDSFMLNVQCVISGDIINGMTQPCESEFYLVVPYRVDENDAIQSIQKNGYYIKGMKEYKNNNGAIKVYNMIKL